MNGREKKTAKILGYGCLLPLTALLAIGLAGSCASPDDDDDDDWPRTRPTLTASVKPSKKVTKSPRPSKTASPTHSVSPDPTPTYVEPVVTYANCSEVRAAGKAPIRRGQPGYEPKLDRDGDGIGCDT